MANPSGLYVQVSPASAGMNGAHLHLWRRNGLRLHLYHYGPDRFRSGHTWGGTIRAEATCGALHPISPQRARQIINAFFSGADMARYL